jgi:hypothetical protein
MMHDGAFEINQGLIEFNDGRSRIFYILRRYEGLANVIGDHQE